MGTTLRPERRYLDGTERVETRDIVLQQRLQDKLPKPLQKYSVAYLEHQEIKQRGILMIAAMGALNVFNGCGQNF